MAAAGGPSHDNIRVNAAEMLVTNSPSFYSEGLVRSPSRASETLGRSPSRASSRQSNQYVYGTQRIIDQNQRALSPTAQMRHTENRMIRERYSETDSELEVSVDIATLPSEKNSKKGGSPTLV